MTDADHKAAALGARLAAALGARLRELRLERGLTQQVLAERVGTYREITKRIEQGRHLPRLDQLVFYARALGVPPSELLCVLDDAASPTKSPASSAPVHPPQTAYTAAPGTLRAVGGGRR